MPCLSFLWREKFPFINNEDVAYCCNRGVRDFYEPVLAVHSPCYLAFAVYLNEQIEDFAICFLNYHVDELSYLVSPVCYYPFCGQLPCNCVFVQRKHLCISKVYPIFKLSLKSWYIHSYT